MGPADGKRAGIPVTSGINHDTAIWRDSDTGLWYLLSGGCTAAKASGINQTAVDAKAEQEQQEEGTLASASVSVSAAAAATSAPERWRGTRNKCSGAGTAWVWTSTDLVNFTARTHITPGGPGAYWELPYLIPFDAQGHAVDDYHHEKGEVYALMFGHGTAYWVGNWDRETLQFTPLGVEGATADAASGTRAADSAGAWPPAQTWPGSEYSFNVHATDEKGEGSARTRRLLFTWVTGGCGPAVPVKVNARRGTSAPNAS